MGIGQSNYLIRKLSIEAGYCFMCSMTCQTSILIPLTQASAPLFQGTPTDLLLKNMTESFL